MKLKQGERSILAYFAQRTDAEACQSQLKELGIDELQLDRVGKYGFRPGEGRHRPVFGDESSMVDAVLGPEPMGDTARVLLASTGEASGLAMVDPRGQRPFLLTVVTPEQRTEEAVSIIKQHGGRV